MARKAQFIEDCQTQITNELQFADQWSALKAEWDTFATNGVVISDEDVAHIGVTAAQFIEGLAAMEEVVEYIHVLTRAAKLYRVRR